MVKKGVLDLQNFYLGFTQLPPPLDVTIDLGIYEKTENLRLKTANDVILIVRRVRREARRGSRRPYWLNPT
ncbi:MAG: hypothetical protein ACLPWG_00655 [Steroidobacteraceae bacterium]